MYTVIDPDLWKYEFTSGPNWAQSSMVMRSPEEYAAIKAKKKLEHEEAVLAEAESILARRRMESAA